MKSREEIFHFIDRVFEDFHASNEIQSSITPFVPTPRREIFDALKHLDSENIINRDKVFIDLGSGIGDVTAIAAYCFGIPTIGIEADQTLINLSRKVDIILQDKLNKTELQYIRGDYTALTLYNDLDVGILFNFLAGNISSVLENIDTGTYFLSYLLGDKLGLPTNRQKALKLIMGKSHFQLMNPYKKAQVINQIIDAYRNWKEVMSIPDTDMYLYLKC